jgi:stearoyl-CoA desaturase (delta-9 desaturase)
MARYADVIKSAAREELAKLKDSRNKDSAECDWTKLHSVRRAIHRNEDILQPEQVAAVDQAIARNKSLATLVQMRRELGRIWESSSASSEQLLHDLQAWCQRAQQSGIAGLEQFAQRLRRYAA